MGLFPPKPFYFEIIEFQSVIINHNVTTRTANPDIMTFQQNASSYYLKSRKLQ